MPRGATVAERPRPDYDPIGVRLGGFLLFPDLSVSESYNSNIFATDTNKRDDFITTIEPSLDLRSDWNNHALNFHADAPVVRHADETDENYTDYTLATNGRLDVARDLRLFGAAGYRVRHEERASPDNQGGAEPTEYSVTAASVGVEKNFNRLSLRLDGKYELYQYQDVAAVGGGTIDQGGRDREQKEVTLRTGYELAPLREIYLLTGFNTRDYDQSRDNNGFARSSDGYTLALGTKYDLTGVTAIDVFAGYRQQDYDDVRLDTVQGWTAGAKLIWNVTRLTTVTGTLSREVEETTISSASGYFATVAELRVDHELLRNLVLDASLAYEEDEFEGIAREDEYYTGRVGAKYLINRNFSLSGGYRYRERASSQSGADFDENVVFVRLSSHL